jgi:tetratricopeptide (TPR) repeat protein
MIDEMAAGSCRPNACWRWPNLRLHYVQSVKRIHAPKLRAEAKHDARQRQLRARTCVVLLTLAWMFLCVPLLRAVSPAPPPETPLGKLHAAQLMGVGLLARHAGKEELEKLDRIFTDLEREYPDDARMRNGHAEFLWSVGQRERAVQTWRAAEKLDPRNAVVLEHLGGSALDDGNAKKAAGYYARALSSAPDNAAYHFSYANIVFLFRHELHDAGHPDSESRIAEAMHHFSEASRLEPLNADYARSLAETYYVVPEPDWKEALKSWQHLYDISVQKDFALLNLARVHLKLGNKEEARARLAEIQDPSFARVKAKLNERIDRE